MSILHWVKKKQLHTIYCCDERTSYEKIERFLIVDYGRPRVERSFTLCRRDT
jgi:hypothetical protein